MDKAKRNKILKVISSKAFIFGIATVFCVLSLIIMLMIDEFNGYRNMIFGEAANDNFFMNVMSAFGIKKYNVHFNTWLLFFVLLGVVWAVLFAQLFFEKIRNKYINVVNRFFKDRRSADIFFRIAYIAACVLICGIVVLILYFCGVFGNWKEESSGVFLNLLASIGIFIACVLVPILVLVAAYYAIKLLFWLASYLAGAIAKAVVNNQSFNDYKRQIEEVGAARGADSADADENLSATEKRSSVLFPALTHIDNVAEAEKPEKHVRKSRQEADAESEQNKKISLENLVIRFQSFLCRKHKLYYELPLLRSFIAGMSASRLIILEGLSGTGKSMLPRMFGEFVGSKTFFCPVQATWKDRTDIVGYYSDFTKEYKETEFLKRLYSASYKADDVNLMVLDEMNISRIEYYFADFLSVLEYPSEDWKIKLMQIKDGQDVPAKLVDGSAVIPTNTWFVGTANTDDSTFTITDKVYDRAIIIDFKEKNQPINPVGTGEPLNLSAKEIDRLFADAMKNKDYCLNEQETKKFLDLCDLTLELFDIRFGNRILTQISNFVPVYVAMGGTKVDALDFMFARKVIRKLEGKYDDYIKDGILKLQKEIVKAYGKNKFPETDRYMKKLLKKFF